MSGEIDNFEVLMQHMDFIDKNDRYIVHILRRPKDCKALTNMLGSNEAQRLIRTYYIDNIDYLKSKISAIKELCQSCNARAYLIVAPKDNFECLLNLGKKILETIQMKNYSVKPEHLLRQAYCENHKSRKKQWVIDLDNDSMVERWIQRNYGGNVLQERVWTVGEVVAFIQNQVVSIGKNPDDVYKIPTRNGWHIITPPFNLQAAQEGCRLMYEGNKKMPVKCECIFLAPGDKGYTGSPGLDKRYFVEEKETTGWLHKDGMTLLYSPSAVSGTVVSSSTISCGIKSTSIMSEVVNNLV